MLIKRYQGKIWIESRIFDDYTQGTRFVIEMEYTSDIHPTQYYFLLQ